MNRWHGVVIAAVLAISLATAAQAVPSDPAQPGVRVELRSGPAPADARVWINAEAVAAGDPAAPDRKAERSDASGATYMGVLAAPLGDRAKEIAKVETGVLVTQVVPGSPASKADIRPDDVITAVGNTAITSPQQLAESVRQYRTGERVRVTWFRDGRRMQETVTLETMPGERPLEGRSPVERPREGRPPEARPPEGRVVPPGEQRMGEAYLGVVGGPMTPDMAEIAGIRRGVVIKGMTEGSPAAKAGLQAGDVITSIDGRDVNEPGALVEIVRAHKAGDSLSVAYYRMGKRGETTVRLGSRPQDVGRPGDGGAPGMPGEPGVSPEMRKYLEGMRPQIEELIKQFEAQGRMNLPPFPMAPPVPGTAAEPYDVGKDMGRIMERIEQLDRRLGDIEKRLDQIEKKK